jgi:hypothetical protein
MERHLTVPRKLDARLRIAQPAIGAMAAEIGLAVRKNGMAP